MIAAMDSRPLIVHVIYRLAVGGLENGVVNLVNQLPAGEFRHAIVSLTDVTDFRRRIARDDVEVIALAKPAGNSLRLHVQLFRLLRRLRPAVVHTRNLAAMEGQLAAALARVPVRIHSEHGWDTADPDGTNPRHIAIRRFYGRFVHRFVALSAHIEGYLRERVGIDPTRIDRICNGVACDRFYPAAGSREAFPHAEFRDPRLVLVGTVGRLEPVKDQVTLARAFVEAIRRSPWAAEFLRLVVVGDGALRREVEAVLDAAGLRPLAWLAGERPDVPALLQGLDVFVLPSRNEGISNTILEAMASGLPVIATNVGGNPELVDNGVTGELVSAGDAAALATAIHRFATASDVRARYSVAARARALGRFSVTGMVERYADLYRRELALRAPGRVSTDVPVGAGGG
jgi:sugar transferase (PEP-CTERM/EpsH1 system associated)